MTSRRPLMTLAVFLTASLPLCAQEPADAKKEPSPEVLEKIKTLTAAVKAKKFRRDEEAVGLIDELLQQIESMHDKSKKAFVGALGGVFKGKKRKPDSIELYTAAGAALGVIGGKESSKILVKAFENKAFSKRKDWAALQDHLVENIGKTKDAKQVKFLVDLASRSHHDGIKVAAGRSLRHFSESEYKVRWAIVKGLITAFDRVANGANQNLNQDPVMEAFKRTLRAISDPWNETLAALTGENFRRAPDWRSWWNDHKSSPKKWKHQTEQ